MTLLKSGLPSNLFSVDAVDISEKAVEKAQEAIYGNHSFRGKDLSYREPYFDKVQNRYRIKQNIKKKSALNKEMCLIPNSS